MVTIFPSTTTQALVGQVGLSNTWSKQALKLSMAKCFIIITWYILIDILCLYSVPPVAKHGGCSFKTGTYARKCFYFYFQQYEVENKTNVSKLMDRKMVPMNIVNVLFQYNLPCHKTCLGYAGLRCESWKHWKWIAFCYKNARYYSYANTFTDPMSSVVEQHASICVVIMLTGTYLIISSSLIQVYSNYYLPRTRWGIFVVLDFKDQNFNNILVLSC